MIRCFILLLVALGYSSTDLYSQILINEVLARNASVVSDDGDQFHDYIELYNAGRRSVNLRDYGVSDDLQQPYKHRIPYGTVDAGEHYFMWAEGEGTDDERRAPFKLSGGGETIYLHAPDGSFLDSIVYPKLQPDIAYARATSGAITWGVTDEPTPDAPNAATVFVDFCPKVKFDVSNPVGIVLEADPFPLLSPDSNTFEIRYTLDGTLPTSQSALYDAPLVIDTTTSIRARVFSPQLLERRPSVYTIIREQDQTLPFAAFTVSPELLFDPNDGLWVLGPNADSMPPFIGANFYGDGEVPAYFEWFNGGERLVSQNLGIQVFGAGSRRYGQKSNDVIARSLYGSDHLDNVFFQHAPSELQSIILRNGGDDWEVAHIRDGFMQVLAQTTNNVGQSYQPSAYFLNGHFWGLASAREKLSVGNLAVRFSIPKDSIDLIELRGVSAAQATKGNLLAYGQLTTFFESLDASQSTALNEVSQHVELNNFIDYYASQIYFGNRDWPGNNNKCFRARDTSAKWRWLLFDTDRSYAFTFRTEADNNALARMLDPVGPAYPNPPSATLFFRKAMEIDSFRNMFISRTCDLLNFQFREERALHLRDSIGQLIASTVARHRDRWDPANEWPNWNNQLEAMDTFAVQRPRFLRADFQSTYSLDSPTLIEVKREGAGSIMLRQEQIRDSLWTGWYFPGLAIQLSVEEVPGSIFSHWEDASGTVLSSALTFSFDPDTLIAVTAVFDADTRQIPEVVINEINYHPGDVIAANEWVELLNVGTESYDLSNFVFTDRDSINNRLVLPDGTQLAPGEFLILAKDTSVFKQAHDSVLNVTGGWEWSLDNGGERIVLYDERGRLVDSVTYSDELPWPQEADGAGYTLELKPGFMHTGNADNWQLSHMLGGSPGAKNWEDLLSTHDHQEGRIIVIPNPAQDWVVLQGQPLGNTPVAYRIIDTQGRIIAEGIWSKKDQQISLSSLMPGTYFLSVLSKRKMQESVQFIKE